jgi:hypothetical protein
LFDEINHKLVSEAARLAETAKPGQQEDHPSHLDALRLSGMNDQRVKPLKAVVSLSGM